MNENKYSSCGEVRVDPGDRRIERGKEFDVQEEKKVNVEPVRVTT